MNNALSLGRRAGALVVAGAAILLTTLLLKSGSGQPANTNPPPPPGAASNAPASEASVELAPSQLDAIKIEPVGTYLFPSPQPGLDKN